MSSEFRDFEGCELKSQRSEFSGRWDGSVVLCGGTSWDGQASSEHHIARHLASRHAVLFVDPPVSLATALRNPQVRASLRGPRLRLIQPGLARLTPVVQPGMRRSGLTSITEWLTRSQIRRAIQVLGARPHARVLASDLFLFEPRSAEYRVLYATDHFEAGAALFGVSRKAVARNEERLRRWTDKVIAVSPSLADHWRARGCVVEMIPNGCDAERFASTDEAAEPSDVRLPRPIAGFAGQINDRIDLALLEAVADTGHSLLVVGPISRVSNRERLERLFARPNVQWVGAKAFGEMPSYLKMIDVGLTPYADTAFNRASMPLKTIEYLAAGRAVVASDLAGARFLETEFVTLVSSPAEFAQATRRLLAQPSERPVVAARRAFAARHSWAVRGGQFASAIGLGAPA